MLLDPAAILDENFGWLYILRWRRSFLLESDFVILSESLNYDKSLIFMKHKL